MAAETTLSEWEQRVADAYDSSGEVPEDPEEARILDYLFESGQLERPGGLSWPDPDEETGSLPVPASANTETPGELPPVDETDEQPKPKRARRTSKPSES